MPPLMGRRPGSQVAWKAVAMMSSPARTSGVLGSLVLTTTLGPPARRP